MDKTLTSDDVAAAFAAFFRGLEGPGHPAVTQALTAAGLKDNYQQGSQREGPNRHARVLQAFGRAESGGGGRTLVEGLLSGLRTARMIGLAESVETVEERGLRLALGRAGWVLTGDGCLQGPTGIDLNTGGREALDEKLAILRANTDQPSVLIGTSKDLLESVAKFVLEENDIPFSRKAKFHELWGEARKNFEILPNQVDPALPGFEAIRAIYQSVWTIAENINTLRGPAGSGHGGTLPVGVSEELALFIAREACSVSEYMLRQLDRQRGR